MERKEVMESDGIDIDIPVTLKAGVEHSVGRIRVLVLRHVYKQKPHFKLLGSSTDEICPACSRRFACQLGLRSHFGHVHSHIPWPWKRPSKPEKRAVPRRVKPTKTKYPKWPAEPKASLIP